MKGGCFDEPGLAKRPHLASELAWKESAGGVNQPFGQDGGRGESVAFSQHRPDQSDDARMVGRHRAIRIKATREIRSARQHDVVPGRVIVGMVTQRANETVLVGSVGQEGKMLAKYQARRSSGDRFELTPDFGRGVGLGVKAFMLREAAGEKNVNAGLRLSTGIDLDGVGMQAGCGTEPDGTDSERASFQEIAPRPSTSRTTLGHRYRFHRGPGIHVNGIQA